MFDHDYKHLVLKAYKNAKIIVPPPVLSPIFVTPEHSKESLENLAISYTMKNHHLKKINNTSIQLFEVPSIDQCCRGYTVIGYSSKEHFYEFPKEDWKFTHWRPSEAKGWIKLESAPGQPLDITCRERFEKIFVYEKTHFARQWGDGTVLAKHGGTDKYGATPVYRFTSPEISDSYGLVKEVWIKPYTIKRHKFDDWQTCMALVPHPYFRWQSTHKYAQCKFSETYLTREAAMAAAPEWQKYFQWAYRFQQKQIFEARENKENLPLPHGQHDIKFTYAAKHAPLLQPPKVFAQVNLY